LQQRINALLALQHAGSGGISGRIRILQMATRSVGDYFQVVAGAVAKRSRLELAYRNRSRGQDTARTVSPQRLVYYRDNWYLDAWCHLREGLRTFALDAVKSARGLEQAALEVAETELDAHFAASYGIFAGPPSDTAVLRFAPCRAGWVATERWHRDQEGRFLDDGSYELRVPYGNPLELIMDILKYGPDVEVLAPAELREEVYERLRAATARYATRAPS
jgi:predicted DNA-binding transcriptional regulator YafY